MYKKIKPHLPYILALFILTILFFIQFFNNDLPAHDILTSKFPLAEKLRISLTEYKDLWPLWDPYGFSGTPFLLKPMLGFDSMLGILLLFLPSVISIKLSFVILFFISGVSMYCFMTYLKVDKKFAFISALVYMLNGHVSSKLLPWGWLTTMGGYSIIPLVFLFGTKAIKEKEWIKNSIMTAIMFAIMLRLGPDMKVGLWIGLIFGLYMIFNLLIRFSTKRFIKYTLIALLIVLIFAGLSAQRILPSKEYISKSSRSNPSWGKVSSRPLKLIDMPKRLIEPGLPNIKREGSGDHIGIIAFLLAGFAIYKKRKNKIVWFFSLAALLSIFIANNSFNTYYLLWKYVPFFKNMRYLDRSLFIFAFSASILAGIGAQALFKNISKKRNIIYTLLIILILANLWLFNYSHYIGNLDEWHNPYDAIENNHILQYLSEQQDIFRIQTWETDRIDWGTDFYNVPLKLEHIFKYDTTWYPPYFNSYLSAANIKPSKLWGMLNVKYLTAKNTTNISGFELIKKFEKCNICYPETEQLQKAYGPYLYENKNFLPRAYLIKDGLLIIGEEDRKINNIYGLLLNKYFNTSNAVIITGREKVNGYSINELKKYKIIFLSKETVDKNSISLLKKYVDSGGILLPDITKDQTTVTGEDLTILLGSLKETFTPIPDKDIIMHNFDKREIRLNKKYKGFLVISEKFSVFPGWELKIDGGKREILNGNIMNSVVYLDGDENSAIFEYKPKSHTMGLYITIITLIGIICYFVYFVYRKKKQFISKNE